MKLGQEKLRIMLVKWTLIKVAVNFTQFSESRGITTAEDKYAYVRIAYTRTTSS